MAKRTCSVPSCPDLVRCRDLCNRHYRRLRKYGILAVAIMLVIVGAVAVWMAWKVRKAATK